LQVIDTGVGISHEIMPMIFEPFFTTKQVGIGTGLGLAVVRGIVTSHNGAITVESQAGEGTTFTVYLPQALDYQLPQVPEQEMAPNGAGKVLFVDDDDAPLRVGKRMLKHLGYDTLATKSSVKALELFKQSPGEYSAVITDLTMPSMSGLELAEAITRIRSDIPILLCTGFDPMLDAERIRAIGIRECIGKPYGLKELGNALARVLRER
jgi:CheY-like chemotaxis protein